MDDKILQEYLDLTTRSQALESELEGVNSRRISLCGQLFARDGKGVSYDFDGTAMVIAKSSKGKHFFTPKNKRGGRKAGKKAAPKTVAPKPIVKQVEVSATLKSTSKVTDGDPLAAALAEVSSR